MMRESMVTSMLPPESTSATRRPASPSGRLSSAASGAAPAPSTTVFSISSRSRIALASSSSFTVTTSSAYRAARSKVTSPTRRTAMPSAIVGAAGTRTRCRACSERCIAGMASASTPITRTAGRRALIASATPAMSPPPPTGTTTASRSSTWSSSSRPSVPCPATTRASSNGWTNTAPDARSTSRARSYASS